MPDKKKQLKYKKEQQEILDKYMSKIYYKYI